MQVLPRTHGSALFTRGETQALATSTLGTSSDEQKIDALFGERFKKFMLHYNFPPFSTGEVKFLRAPRRREIGHGALAERALTPMLPDEAEFPYTVRVVSEVLESNGSSSMATVCGGSLALMDAGVPIKAPVAGIAMGLIKEGDKIAVLTDILGDEDHLGDMDFKVAGTATGVTAIQMDNKVGGITKDIMRRALMQARDARLLILSVMEKAIAAPRKDVSALRAAHRHLKIKPDKIRDVIGPGGKVIRGLVEETGCKIDVEDDGTVLIAVGDGTALEKAISMIQQITAEPEIGKIYNGVVRKIVDFGAFVEIMPGTDGLLHISQISDERVRAVEDVLHEGDEIPVKVLDVDRSGKIRLSCARPRLISRTREIRTRMIRKTVVSVTACACSRKQMPSMVSSIIGIWVENGSRYEVPAENGTSHFIEHLLFKGTKKRSAAQIAEDFDAVGGVLNAFTGKEYTCYYAKVLGDDLKMATELLADIFLESVFDPATKSCASARS